MVKKIKRGNNKANIHSKNKKDKKIKGASIIRSKLLKKSLEISKLKVKKNNRSFGIKKKLRARTSIV
jgi:hypothetical protein